MAISRYWSGKKLHTWPYLMLTFISYAYTAHRHSEDMQ